MPEICLVMIVRDEAHVIERCLRSVMPLIGCWCIVDTGSTDRTPAIIEAALAGLPGALHHRSWVDFGHNRSEAMRLARGQGDWLLLIDADEELIIDERFVFPASDGVDAWQILQRPGASTIEFHLPRLLRADKPWRFEGVLHEYLACDEPFQQSTIEGLAQIGHFDSARNRQPQRQKYLKDAELLNKALEREPDHSRYQFYLAQSLRDAGEIDAAIDAYRRRSEMSGWDEERFCALLELARLLERQSAEHASVSSAYLNAWNARPTRAEPLVELARIHRQREEHALAQLYAERAAALPRPADLLFVDAGVYRWRAKDELSVASYWTGQAGLAARIARELLEGEGLPDSERERVAANLRFFE